MTMNRYEISAEGLSETDPNSFRMQRIITDGTRHSDRNIRLSCIKMLPVIMVDAEVRIMA